MIAVRRLLPDDARSFRTLRLSALTTDPDAFSATLEEEASISVDDMANRLGRNIVFGAFSIGEQSDGGILDGFTGYRRERAIKERHKALVWGFYVAPEARRRGIGRALMAALIAHAQSDPGVEALRLHVATTNPAAIGLYRQAGFEIVGTEPHALKTPLGYIDEHHMVRFL
jgi:ribosomal protein S18 acetylase RimI-like enzyme